MARKLSIILSIITFLATHSLYSYYVRGQLYSTSVAAKDILTLPYLWINYAYTFQSYTWISNYGVLVFLFSVLEIVLIVSIASYFQRQVEETENLYGTAKFSTYKEILEMNLLEDK
jgi:hypothetical protein